MSKTIGILGGMGPEATIYLFDLIVKLTRAKNDQDHIPIIVFNNPKIPDRTAAIRGEGPSPLPHLREGALFLEKAGADFILMPCVTAHYYYPEIVKHMTIPFLHLLEETAEYVNQKFPHMKKMGLLATTGTIQTGLFQEIFNKKGINIVVPTPEKEDLVMNALYQSEGIKAGFKERPRQMVIEVVHHLYQQKAEAIIAGCTEMPLVVNQSDMEIPFINPLKIIAENAILKAGYPLAGT